MKTLQLIGGVVRERSRPVPPESSSPGVLDSHSESEGEHERKADVLGVGAAYQGLVSRAVSKLGRSKTFLTDLIDYCLSSLCIVWEVQSVHL
jgi:hypothetical protein